MFSRIEKYKDIALLILRIGLGLTFILIHGWPKIFGGVERWAALGGAMKNIGITFYPEFWGFMAAFAEFGGGIAVLLGFLFRPFTALLVINLFVAMMSHFARADQWVRVAYPMELMIVFFALFFIGPGKYSLDYLFFSRSDARPPEESG